ncbi:MAG: EAL domain-containing protein [Pseudomonadota bacterium]
MFAHRYLVTGNPIYAIETEATITEFATAHEVLLLAAQGDEHLMRLYSPGKSSGLDYQVDTFVSGALALLSVAGDQEARRRYFREIDVLGRDVLLRRLDMAVSAFESRANARVEWLKRVQRVAFVSSLVLLAAELFLIFLPLHQWILQTISRLNREANYDALTGLINRKHFGEALSDLTAKSDTSTTIAVLAMDLDGFKAVNDALGHPAGDELLKLISTLLREKSACLGDIAQPLIARMGGDEFMMACRLPKHNAVQIVEEFSDQVLSGLQSPVTLHVGHAPVTCIVGMSIGFSHAEDASGCQERLVSNADIALYASKNSGKGRLTAFRNELRVVAEKRLRLETELRRAVMGGEFRPFFQPQIDLATGALEGFDLIACWEHPDDGLLPLDRYISDAEQIGVLDMIEASLILTSLEAIKALMNDGFDVPRLSLTASAPTLRDSEFVSNLISAVNMFELPKTAIAIAVKESVLTASQEDPAIQSIQLLSQSGFGTIIDGFGAGYASLNAVSGLQLKSVQIDGSLVGSADRIDGLKVLRATIAMGKTMGLRVGAAGVDTTQHADMLRDMGCDFAQGANFGLPTDISGARDFLQNLAAGGIERQTAS